MGTGSENQPPLGRRSDPTLRCDESCDIQIGCSCKDAVVSVCTKERGECSGFGVDASVGAVSRAERSLNAQLVASELKVITIIDF